MQEFARRLKLGFKFHGEAALRRLGAGAFLAVSRGNGTRDAGIARLTYRPRGGAAPALSLVGKGICFDTGGTNLKPHKSMLDMHTDMEGSAVALGSLYALHALRSPMAVDCWLAITENRIGPLAYKPQDGARLQWHDHPGDTHRTRKAAWCRHALSPPPLRKPRAIIDRGRLRACVYGSPNATAARLPTVRRRAIRSRPPSSSGERVWCFPWIPTTTPISRAQWPTSCARADGKGDHILAARFLSRFVPKEIAWLHLDLAAGSRHGGLAHIASEITGFGVRYTLDLVRRGWPAPAGKSAAARP